MSQHQATQLYTERVYIDPERLLKLKKERKPFKQVPSIFEPPPQLEQDKPTQPSSLRIDKSSAPTPQPEAELVRSQILSKSTHPNIQFILSLIGEIKHEHLLTFEEGDCIAIDSEDRCLLLEGEVKVTGVGNRQFILGQGSILFITRQTIQKIKQVVCLKASKILKLPQRTFAAIKNYIFLKNSEKIKYLKYCPFFIWAEALSEDLASFMTMQVLEKGQHVYARGESADQIFFVKEGVVLLERSTKVTEILRNYESHYERSEISPSEATLVVKKGMVFGVDGILLNDSQSSPVSRESNFNSEEMYSRKSKQNSMTRIYTARTLGRTELYILQRQLLQSLFDTSDILEPSNFNKQLTKQDLQRISLDYSDIVTKHRSLPKISQAVLSKQMPFDPEEQNIEDIIEKKTRVKQIRSYQQNIKKNSIANIITDTKHQKFKGSSNASTALQQHFIQKLGIAEIIEQAQKVFPRLSSHLNKKRGHQKNSRSQTTDKYIIGWLKCQDPAKHKATPQKISKQGKDRLKLINVRSYRSIIPSHA